MALAGLVSQQLPSKDQPSIISSWKKIHFKETAFKIKFTLTNSLIVVSVSHLFDPGLEAR